MKSPRQRGRDVPAGRSVRNPSAAHGTRAPLRTRAEEGSERLSKPPRTRQAPGACVYEHSHAVPAGAVAHHSRNLDLEPAPTVSGRHKRFVPDTPALRGAIVSASPRKRRRAAVTRLPVSRTRARTRCEISSPSRCGCSPGRWASSRDLFRTAADAVSEGDPPHGSWTWRGAWTHSRSRRRRRGGVARGLRSKQLAARTRGLVVTVTA